MRRKRKKTTKALDEKIERNRVIVIPEILTTVTKSDTNVEE